MGNAPKPKSQYVQVRLRVKGDVLFMGVKSNTNTTSKAPGKGSTEMLWHQETLEVQLKPALDWAKPIPSTNAITE